MILFETIWDAVQGIGFETIREIDVNSWTRRQEAQSRIGREAGTILTVARHVTDSLILVN